MTRRTPQRTTPQTTRPQPTTPTPEELDPVVASTMPDAETTGDRVSEQTDEDAPEAQTPESEPVASQGSGHPMVVEPKGRIIEGDGDLVFEAEMVGGQLIASEDVYRKVYAKRSKRPIYIHLVHKGSPMATNSVRALS